MKRFENKELIIGNSSELESVQIRKGVMFYAEDTGITYLNDGATWSPTQPAASEGGGNLVVTASFTNAEYIASYPTPVEIIPAPGADKAIKFISGWTKYTYAGDPYTAGAEIHIVPIDYATADANNTRLTSLGIDTTSFNRNFVGVSETDLAPNTAIHLTSYEQPVGGAGAVISISIQYEIIDLSILT
ncbi:MAG: hypothetical protein KUG81_02665 [Gammaproteobacteria bacterium]|nr:hypothetical protein [Gammaproteobacteria bacterium]